jgi:ATP-dependent Clp protease, protease subunit
MENKKSYIGIRNSVDSSTLELYFTDFIFDGFDWNTFEEINMVQDMIDKINAAKPSKINVTINSLGGDVMIGLAIYNFLKNYNAKVQVDIIGFAASIASIIAMSASKGKLRIAKNGFMIIHSASSGLYGNAKELRDQAAVLDKISGEMAEIYAFRSGKEASYFTALWADGGDVWLTGQEAKDMGLADETLNGVAMSAKLNLEAFGFKNIPSKITSSITQNQKLNMAFKKTITAAKAESFAVVEGGFLLEEDQLNNIEAALNASDISATALATANDSLATATEEIMGLKASATTSEKTISTQATRIAELEAEVIALGKKPSGNGSTLNITKDVIPDATVKPSYASETNPANEWIDKQLSHRKKTA